MTEGPALRRRLASALVFGPLTLLVVWTGGWVLELALLALATAGGREVSVLLGRMGFPAPRGIWIVSPVLFLASLHAPLGPTATWLTWGVWCLATVWLFVPSLPREGRRSGLSGPVHGLGLAYVALLAAALCHLGGGPWAGELSPQRGARGLLVALLSTWACDTGAYLAGSILRGPRLWASVSPAKTWAGAIGGLVAASLAGAASMRWLFPETGPADGLFLGAAIGLLAPIGDLIESRLKRAAGAKDSGRFLPGHGGVLDRFDSVLYIAPAAVGLLTLLATDGAR